MKYYQIDVESLSDCIREALEKDLETHCFTVSPHITSDIHIDYYRVSWNNNDEISDVINFPEKCVITEL